VVVGDTLITAASFPQSKNQRPVIIAYRLGATRQRAHDERRDDYDDRRGAATGKQVFVSTAAAVTRSARQEPPARSARTSTS